MSNVNANLEKPKKLGRPVGLKDPMRKISVHLSDEAMDYSFQVAELKRISVASVIRELVDIGLKTQLKKGA